MANKSESSKANKKVESTAKKAQDTSQVGPESAVTGYESLLGDGVDGMASLNSYLQGADEASRARVVTDLQQSHGNSFVQRMLLQRVDENFVGDPSEQEGQVEGEPEEESANWQGWLQGSKSGARTAVMLWTQMSRLTGVNVMGSTAIGGRIEGSFPSWMVSSMMTAEGAPNNVSSAFAQATAQVWSMWTSLVNVPGLIWYPQFAAFPGPVAPPIPNIPAPLSQIAIGAQIDSGLVAASITGSLGDNANDDGAQESVQQYADWLSSSFDSWINMCLVTQVMGMGNVFGWDPPAVSAGMVTGTAESYGPFILGAPPFGS